MEYLRDPLKGVNLFSTIIMYLIRFAGPDIYYPLEMPSSADWKHPLLVLSHLAQKYSYISHTRKDKREPYSYV